MDYIRATEILKKIENDYDVMDIKAKGVSIWPFLRIFLFQLIEKEKSTHKKNKSNILAVFKALKAYNPLSIFKKYDIWVFNSTERRKLIGDKYIQRISGYFIELEYKTLNIEKCSTYPSHYKKHLICERNIFSESYILLFAHLLEPILRLFNTKILNVHILDNIIHEYNIPFDYNYFTRYLYSQKLIVDFLLLLSHKPKKVFIECPYNIMGYVWSFKQHNIPVIELQHGVINKNHYAYNSIYNSKELYPDVLCVYGETEFNYFTRQNLNYATNIRKTGLYILEKSNSNFVTDIFKEYRNLYSSIIVVAGQKSEENTLASFIKDTAYQNPSILFIYVPRYPFDFGLYKRKNVIYAPNINIYEYLKWCDIHCTISSTTCLEAQYFCKPTIFYNYKNLSKAYYSETLKKENGAIYINKSTEFINAINQLKEIHINYKSIFAKNCTIRIRDVISNI